MNSIVHSIKVIYIISFIVVCLSFGQILASLLTSLVFGVNIFLIPDLLNDPISSEKALLPLLAIFRSLFCYLIIPVAYLFLFRYNTVQNNNIEILNNLKKSNRLHFAPFIIAVLLIVAIVPFISLLIQLNSAIDLPAWLAESEDRARQLTIKLLSYHKTKDLIIVVATMAIVPGIVEEVFFRGIVQTQLHHTFHNKHYAILLAAILFSFFHFQFSGFVPRIVLGILLGYLFMWSDNIWYPIVGHITNNLIATLLFYFSDLNVYDTKGSLVFLSIISVFITVTMALFFKKLVKHNTIYSQQ